jgi:hypothetical protein
MSLVSPCNSHCPVKRVPSKSVKSTVPPLCSSILKLVWPGRVFPVVPYVKTTLLPSFASVTVQFLAMRSDSGVTLGLQPMTRNIEALKM